MNNIVQSLVAMQTQNNITESAISKRLGISRVGWYFLKTGRREPSLKFLKSVMREFPELTTDVLIYLKSHDQEIKING